MKRFVLILVAMMSMSTLSAQMYEKSLAEAQIAYDNAVALSKTAINEARSSERRITSAANDRLVQAREEFEMKNEYYSLAVEELKRRLAEEKQRYNDAADKYKQEVTRTKQEIAAAKANTKAVEAQQKSAIAQAKAEIARIKSLEQNKRNK